jgi:hypothetical protein
MAVPNPYRSLCRNRTWRNNDGVSIVPSLNRRMNYETIAREQRPWPSGRRRWLVRALFTAKGDHVPKLEVGQTVGLGWYSGSCMACSRCLAGDHNHGEIWQRRRELRGYSVERCLGNAVSWRPSIGSVGQLAAAAGDIDYTRCAAFGPSEVMSKGCSGHRETIRDQGKVARMPATTTPRFRPGVAAVSVGARRASGRCSR